MNLLEIFIRRPVLTLMLNASLLVFGIIGLQRLPVRELPDIDPPLVNVLTVYPGASAEVVETEVTERLEDAISGVEGIKLLTSESREQASTIAVEFRPGRDIDLAAQDVRDRVARIRQELPDDVQEPVISKQDANAQPIMWVSFFSDRHDVETLSRIADEQVKDRLQSLDGVSSVIIGGEKRFAVRIRLDPVRMASREITALDVERALQTQNIELPSGRIENVDRELPILTQGQFPDAEAFNNLVLRQDGTRVVRLRDVGKAEAGVEDERGVARFNGKPTVGIGVVRKSQANTIDVARGVKAAMAELATTLPRGISVEFPYDESRFVEQSVREVWQTLLLASVLVVLVIFIFLRNVRATLLPALAIPVSLCTTFGVIFLLGYSINIFTLLALVLAIGLVVDDAIVVLENITRHLEMGEPPMQATLKAMREISFPVIATTLSLVAVFIPVIYIGGLTGRLLREFSVSVASAVVISTVVALTLSPMAGARILRATVNVKHGRLFNFFERRFDRLNQGYAALLQQAFRFKWVVMGLAAFSLVLSVLYFRELDKEFLPGEDKSRFLVMALAPEGSTPEYTDRMVRQVEDVLSEVEGIQSYFTAVALPFNGPGDPTFGIGFARLDESGRPHINDLTEGPAGMGFRLFNDIEGAFAFPILPKAVDLSFGQPFNLVLSHPDLEILNEQVQKTTAELSQSGFLMNVRPTFQMNKPELRVNIDRDRANDLGVSVQAIARTLQILYGGLDLSDIKQSGKQYDVIVQLGRDARRTPDQLHLVHVRSRHGALVPLSAVATVKTGAGPNRIERFGRQRSASIEGTPMGVTLGTAVERTEAILKQSLPSGFSFDWKGEARDLKESSRDLYLFLGLAIIIVYMVLAAQFESFVDPFVVMLALPLALVGAFGLLYVLSWVNWLGMGFYAMAHYMPDPSPLVVALQPWVPRIPSMTMNVFSQVGLILLVGLVTKNSILLVEFANQKRAEGLPPKQAMFEAARIRLRPILMTSLATIAGILPIAIGFGDASESRRPLGVVAVGGMVSSTLLTLVVIPVIYILLARLTRARYRSAETTPAAGDTP